MGLGDAKLLKNWSRWIEKVKKYAKGFENDGMRKVVFNCGCLEEGS